MSQECTQSNCENSAAFRMFWPGKPPTFVCNPCRERALGIAGAMGFHVHIEPINPPDATDIQDEGC